MHKHEWIKTNRNYVFKDVDNFVKSHELYQCSCGNEVKWEVVENPIFKGVYMIHGANGQVVMLEE